MCEKRSRKMKKGSQISRLREARRLHRLQLIASPMASTSDESNSLPSLPTLPVTLPITLPYQPQIDKVAQNRVILELAMKTIALMHKNRLIQQKIIALQKETSEFVASVMNNPENRHKYANMPPYGVAPGQVQMQTVMKSENTNLVFKVEPEV